MPDYAYDKSDELADWIQAIGRWKSRQRELKKLVHQIDTILREREEMVEEALWLRAVARDKDAHAEADEALSKAVALAQSQHENTVQELEKIHENLKSSHVEDLFDRPRAMISSKKTPRDPVEEASRDSFPASDPPSFNPGRA